MGRTRQFEVGLTPRQKEVLRLIQKGHTNGEIAEKLGISLAGAKWHVSELLSQFAVTSREDLAELMEGERRGPVERARGWMAGLAGLMSLKVGGGVAAATMAVAAGVGGMMVLGGGTNTPPASETTEVTERTGPTWTEDEAIAVAWAAVPDKRLLSNTDVLDFQFGYGALELVQSDWLPGTTSHPVSNIPQEWHSPGGAPIDIWVVAWRAPVLRSDGTAAFPDGVVLAEIVLEDGNPTPVAQSLQVYDLNTGVRMGISEGLTVGLGSVEARLIDMHMRLARTQVLMNASVNAEPAMVPTPVPPLRPPVTITVGDDVVLLQIDREDGVAQIVDLGPGSPESRPFGLRQVSVQLEGATTVIAFDAAGNEVGVREVP